MGVPSIAITRDFLDSDRTRREARAARFATSASPSPPIVPQRRIAWPGGKLTTNKQDAVDAFIERKRQEGNLSREHEAALRASLSARGATAAVVQQVNDRPTNMDVSPPAVCVSSTSTMSMPPPKHDHSARTSCHRATAPLCRKPAPRSQKLPLRSRPLAKALQRLKGPQVAFRRTSAVLAFFGRRRTVSSMLRRLHRGREKGAD